MINILSRKCLDEKAADVTGSIEPMDIEKWARDETGGQLPEESARAFGRWLYEAWGDFADDEEATVEGVLKGAVNDWCGGRSF